MKNNIRTIRKNLRMSLDAVAEQTGTTRATIQKLEKGTMQLTTKWMEKLSKALKCSPLELISDNAIPTVPVLGYVGAGAKVFSIDDHAPGAAFEEVDCPTGYTPENIVALRVRGDSMLPMLEDGWLIFYRRECDGVPPDCIGRLCVVKLPDDGVLVKKVRQGSKPNLYHLISHNADAIFDVQLAWASRVIDIRPR